jgi:phosphoribosylformimino-5-aminoimidazole carboxamide ribotide isomerase
MIEIIPAMDIMNGRCVRLSQGDYDRQKFYDEDPVAMAGQFEENGFARLHLVDLDGARAAKMINLATLKNIAAATTLTIDYSGGIRSGEDVVAAFAAGAAIVSIGSMSYTQPDVVKEWGKTYGFDKFIISVDVRDEFVLTNGWMHQTGTKISDFLEQYTGSGFSRFCCTDVSKDGMLAGVNTGLYHRLKKAFPFISLTASGGVSSMADIQELQEIGCDSVIVGKAIYEHKISIEELNKFRSAWQ